MPTATVSLMWIGRVPPITPGTGPATQAQLNAWVPYSATGKDQIEHVRMTGDTYSGSYQTAYNPNTASGFPRGGTKMTYKSPYDDATVADTRITSFFQATFRLTVPDGSGGWTAVDRPGTIIQMRNGDVFFRPQNGMENAWNGITQISKIEVISAAPYPNAQAAVSAIGFSASVQDVNIVCFARGTLIRTGGGEVPIQDLRVGDQVVTMDHGLQDIRWIGSRRLPGWYLADLPKLRPVRIQAGALDGRLPQHDLWVTQQHRVLVRSKIAERIFGKAEVLVAAKHLLAIDGFEIAGGRGDIEYWHFMCDAHEIVFANGAASETLFVGPQALKMLDDDARQEILALCPDLAGCGDAPTPARPFAMGKDARLLADRTMRNGQRLVA